VNGPMNTNNRLAIPEVNPAHTDEQGRPIARPVSGAGGAAAPQPAKSPLDLSGVDDIISASGLGAQKNLSKSQFPKMPGAPEAAPAAEGAGAAEGAAGGAAAAEELLPLLAL
jgi:hypothetical protein